MLLQRAEVGHHHGSPVALLLQVVGEDQDGVGELGTALDHGAGRMSEGIAHQPHWPVAQFLHRQPDRLAVRSGLHSLVCQAPSDQASARRGVLQPRQCAVHLPEVLLGLPQRRVRVSKRDDDLGSRLLLGLLDHAVGTAHAGQLVGQIPYVEVPGGPAHVPPQVPELLVATPPELVAVQSSTHGRVGVLAGGAADHRAPVVVLDLQGGAGGRSDLVRLGGGAAFGVEPLTALDHAGPHGSDGLRARGGGPAGDRVFVAMADEVVQPFGVVWMTVIAGAQAQHQVVRCMCHRRHTPVDLVQSLGGYRDEIDRVLGVPGRVEGRARGGFLRRAVEERLGGVARHPPVPSGFCLVGSADEGVGILVRGLFQAQLVGCETLVVLEGLAGQVPQRVPAHSVPGSLGLLRGAEGVGGDLHPVGQG